jgi:hypothetical protein
MLEGFEVTVELDRVDLEIPSHLEKRRLEQGLNRLDTARETSSPDA